MPYRGKQGHGRQYRLLQRKDDPEKPGEITGTVQISGFFQIRGHGFHRGFDKNHIIYGNHAGNDINPEGIHQMEHTVI